MNIEKKVIKDIHTAVNPTGIQPNHDYYSYINDRWIDKFKRTKHQKYIVQVDDFRLTQDKVYHDLVEIINEYLDTSSANKGLAKGLANAYRAFKTLNTHAQIRETADKWVQTVTQSRSIWELIGTVNRNEIISFGSPFVWSINPDDKHPDKYISYIGPPQMTMIDIDIYFDDPTDTVQSKIYKSRYRNKWNHHIDQLFTFCFGKNHGYRVQDVFDTEKEILDAMCCTVLKDADVDPDNYNKITATEAMSIFQFDWKEICRHIGFAENIIPDSFICSNLNYLHCGTKLMAEKWNSVQWRTYWIYIYIRQQIRWSYEGMNIYFKFHGLFMRAQEDIVNVKIRPVFGMAFLFNTFLTNQYVSKFDNPEITHYVKNLADELKNIFIGIIQRNTWLQPATKQKALSKLTHIKLIVGSPKQLREDPLLPYLPNDPWHNLMLMSNWRIRQAIHLVGQPIIDIPVIDWAQIPPKFISTQAYVVNAYYTPTFNSIYIPLGYLQAPFVDLNERGIEYNLSRIGFTIGHEMSHSLDDWGSKYDEHGKLFNWWTPKDTARFTAIQNDVIRQYETVAKRDGIKFDASIGVGEDLADISGLAICIEYLWRFQQKNADILPIEMLSFEAFFVYIAIQSRQQISKKAIVAQLKSNPHPLDKYRCNVPLSRSEIFRSIYNVKPSDDMWWHSTSSIWNHP
jgi:putative endopeptidase